MSIYYIYSYVRQDGTPYYIGKGKGNRAYKRRNSCPVPTDKSRIVFLAENLEEEAALEMEKWLIASYGRKSDGTGILRNLSEGGESPHSGCTHSEETKRKIGEWNKKKMEEDPEWADRLKNANKGRKFGDEWRKKMSDNNAMKNPEHRAKVSKALKGRVITDEWRRKISEAKRGKKRDP